MAEPWTARSALWQLTLGRVREYLREPEALFWAFAFPAILTLALGIAFRAPTGAVVHVGVEDGPGAAAVVSTLAARPGFTAQRVDAAAIENALRDGRVDIVVRPGTPPEYRYDPARAESRLARLAVDDALERAAGREDHWTPVEHADEVPGSRYIDWLVPGLLGLNVMSTGLWSIGFSIVGTRNRKLLKRLVATPMRRRDYLAAQILARLVFLVPEAVIFLVFARLVFGVTSQGSYVAFGALLLLGGISFSGLGLLIASRARTIEAVSGLLNLVMLPLWLLSGVFFPTSQFPAAMQPIIQAIPLTALNDGLRAVMLDGRTLSAVPLEIGVLAVWGLVGFVLALRLFRWQ
jgi:ABC transporter DrrB family efflux protein